LAAKGIQAGQKKAAESKNEYKKKEMMEGTLRLKGELLYGLKYENRDVLLLTKRYGGSDGTTCSF
jgi:hypothetical protein